VCETILFFRGWILICLTWNLFHFVPNSVEIKKKTISGYFFHKFSPNQGYPLPKLVKFRPSFCNLARTFCFRKTSFVHSRSGTYYALLLGCFGLKFLPDVRHYVYWVLVEIWGPDSSHKIGNKFFIDHCQGRKEGSFVCVKLFDFFRGRILVCLTWNLSRFVPNSVEILTWNFSKKLFRENFSEILCKPRLSSTKTCEISPYFLQFLFWLRIARKKFTQVLPYVVLTQVRRHVHKRITKRRYGEENPGRFVFGKLVLFTLDLGLTTPYSLGVSVWNVYQTFATVSIEFWLRFEAQIRPTRLAINFLLITARVERKVCLCVKLFDFFRGRILIRLTWNLSQFVPNSVEILTWNFGKKLFREKFSEILCKQRLSSTKTCEISPYFLQFLFSVRIALKKFTLVLPYVVWTQVRRHVHKRITKENPGRFVFGKPVLFTLRLGLTMPYSLGVSVWNFYQTFATVSIEFWLAQIRPTRLAINFLLITARAERKVCLGVKLFDFFRGRVLIRLNWNLLRFVPNSVEILTWNFRKKLFRENFLEILFKSRLS